VTTVEQFRAAIAHPASREVSIAGVPWPAYKVVALLCGLIVMGVVGLISASAAPAVLAAAAAATTIWVGFAMSRSRDH